MSFGDGNGEADGGNIPADAKPVYALYIYPREDLWEMGALETFVKTVESRAPAGVIVTGIAPQLYHSTLAIHQAFVESTIYALILIFVLVLSGFAEYRPDAAGHFGLGTGVADAVVDDVDLAGMAARSIWHSRNVEFREFFWLADFDRGGT